MLKKVKETLSPKDDSLTMDISAPIGSNKVVDAAVVESVNSKPAVVCVLFDSLLLQ